MFPPLIHWRQAGIAREMATEWKVSLRRAPVFCISAEMKINA